MPTELGLLTALIEKWPDLIARKGFGPNHCILATRTAIEVGRYFGFEWSPLPIDFAMFNAEGFESFMTNIPVSEWPESAWSIGASCGLANGEWTGHMVVRTHRHLADLSAAQFDRPAKDLHVKPWIIERSTETPPWWFNRDDGVRFVIMPRPDVRSYHKARDWTANYRDLAAQLIRELRVK